MWFDWCLYFGLSIHHFSSTTLLIGRWNFAISGKLFFKAIFISSRDRSRTFSIELIVLLSLGTHLLIWLILYFRTLSTFMVMDFDDVNAIQPLNFSTIQFFHFGSCCWLGRYFIQPYVIFSSCCLPVSFFCHRLLSLCLCLCLFVFPFSLSSKSFFLSPWERCC